jgi:hypothetical protein
MDEDGFSTKVRPVKEGSAIQSSYIDVFVRRMKQRLKRGEVKYGEKSFLTDNIFTDIKEELLDVANYAYLMFERISRLEDGEKASDYLNFCNAVDITDESEATKKELVSIFEYYHVCYRLNGREHHFCKKERYQDE